MPLSYSENEKVKAYMNGKNRRCTVCGNNSWGIFEEVVSPVCLDIKYKRVIEGKLFPVVILMCSECGSVIQISAKKVGLF